MTMPTSFFVNLLLAPLTAAGLAGISCTAIAAPASASLTAIETTDSRVGQGLGQGLGQGREGERGDDRNRRDQEARDAREARDAERERAAEMARWLDRLQREDREALDILIDYGAPEFADDLRWFHGEKATIESMRGKVVVIQSFTTRATRTTPQRLGAALGDRRDRGVVLLALHTPENADRAIPAIESMETSIPILLDESGQTSDRFGIFRRPVNVVIDRTGNVRFAGLNDRGLEAAVDLLLAETHDSTAKPREREAPEAFEVRWPTFTSSVGRARDLRGQRSPEFHVAEWIRGDGSPGNRLTVIDFWATWCGPCRAMIPHMNEITEHYGDRVFVVGLSSEARSAFSQGNLANRRLRLSQFSYPLAIDPQRRMMGAFGVQSIPHVAVISGDGVVRWQGHPQGLTRQVMDQLVTANEQLRRGTPEIQTAPPARWAQQTRRN